MQRKAFVLLSGGLDSTTCLYKAIYDYAEDLPGDIRRRIEGNAYTVDTEGAASTSMDPIPWVEAVSVDYGQRHKKELEYARKTCDRLGIRHTILDVGNLLSGKTVMLSADSVGAVEVPDVSYSDIKGVSPTYVPFRNGLMLSALTAHAQKYVDEQTEKFLDEHDVDRDDPEDLNDGREAAAEHARNLCGIYFGAHSEDAQNWAYPDCTPEFIGAMANAIYIGTYCTVRLHTPLEWLLKSDIVKLGDSLGVPFESTWSCYKGEEYHCGTCPTCRSRKEAFQIAGIHDPTQYADSSSRDPFTPNPVNPVNYVEDVFPVDQQHE